MARVIEETSSEKHWARVMRHWNLFFIGPNGEDAVGAVWNCDICKAEWNLGPIVKDSIWKAICLSANCHTRTRMCLSCMEQHLGRSISTKYGEDMLELLWNVWRKGAVS